MKAISLLYHDVVRCGDYEISGFPGEGAARYKLAYDTFNLHLAALDQALAAKPVTVSAALQSSHGNHPVLLTFDDGGGSAYPDICEALDRYGWKGHFFITTNYIGRPTFVSESDICMLRRRGHVIGSHSSSHPERMSHQSWEELLHEWGASTQRLSDILGEAVTVASVPNGYFSNRVAEAASRSGINVLFTSEPVRNTRFIAGCHVFGRYIMRPRMAPERIVALARGRRGPRWNEYLLWNAKKLAKVVGRDAYLKMRTYLLEHSHR